MEDKNSQTAEAWGEIKENIVENSLNVRPIVSISV